jgi:gas vesicle protein
MLFTVLGKKKTIIMKYKKLLSDTLPRESDSSKAIVALLTGLAVGAVLGVLFAPSSGEETRGLISEKANDLTDNLKDKYQSVKDQVLTGKDELVDYKDRVVDQAKSKAKEVSDKVKDYKDESVDAAKEGIKDASDDANNAVQNA